MKEISVKRLFKLAGEEALALEEEIFRFNQLFLLDYELHIFFDNPIVAKEAKINALRQIFPGNSPLFSDLIGLLIDEGLERKVGELTREFSAYVAAQLGVTYVNASSAYRLSDTERQKLFALFKKKVVIREEIDPGLIGGFKALTDDKLFLDASLKGNIQRLKEGMIYA